MLANQGTVSLMLLIGCNLMTGFGAVYMEYHNYRARQQ